MVRVLEISRIPLFKFCFPQETTWFKLGASLIQGDEGCVPERFTPGNVLRLIRDVRRGAYDLVALPAVEMGYAYDPNARKRLLRRLIRAGAASRLTAGALEVIFRWSKNVVVFADVTDSPALSYEVCALIPGFLAYFKREFYPDLTLRAGAPWQGINARVTPWSLFLPTAEYTPAAVEKTTDVFFAGVCNCPARHEGLPQIRQLEARGYRVDAPTGRLGYQEYLQRMAAAWLVWSPGGFGWDCYRHYEAAFAGAVPVIDEPAHPRQRPYEDGVECFYYQPEGSALQESIMGALADKPRLRAMAARARERVLARYTRPALVAAMQASIVERLRADGRRSRLLQEWAGCGDGPAAAAS